MKHRGWVVFSGFLWFVMGTFLLYKGLHLIAEGRLSSHSMNSLIKNMVGPEIRSRASYHLSLSRLTFTHQMIRLILAEQLYRALEIEQNSSYHK